MAITFTGSGGLFTRLGRLFYVLSLLNTWRGTTLPTEVNEAITELDGATDALRSSLVRGMLAAESGAQSALSSLGAAVRTAAEKLLVQQVNDDNPLTEKTVEAALREMIRQMRTGAYYVDDNAVSATLSQTTTGDGTATISLYDAYGFPLQNVIPEDIEISVDDVTTPAAARLRLKGESAVADRLSWEYPTGSAINKTLTAIDAADSTANLIANGDMEDWTGAALDSFSAVVGAYGTDWSKETTNVYKGTNALKLLGDGATLSQIRQDITSKVSANKQYLASLRIRRGASAIAAGVLTIDLYDGSAVMNDNAGNPISTTIDLTALTTSYLPALASFGFRIPEPKPTTVWLRLRVSTAITNTRIAYLDHFALAEGTQVYDGGPVMGFFSGATAWNLQDYTGGGSGATRVFRAAIANDLTGDWQHYFDRIFNMRQFGLILPVSGTTMINDNLIA